MIGTILLILAAFMIGGVIGFSKGFPFAALFVYYQLFMSDALSEKDAMTAMEKVKHYMKHQPTDKLIRTVVRKYFNLSE